MKKLLALLLALAMLLTVLVGCGGDDEGGIIGKWVASSDDGFYMEFMADGQMMVGAEGRTETAEYTFEDGILTITRNGQKGSAEVKIDGDKMIVAIEGRGEGVLYREGKAPAAEKEADLEGKWQNLENVDETLVIKGERVEVYENGEVLVTYSCEQNENEIIFRRSGEINGGELHGNTLSILGYEYEKID